MYFFYIDESGNTDPKVSGLSKGGDPIAKDYLYVISALSLFEQKWERFDLELSREKRLLLDDIQRRLSRRLEFADAEIHSNIIRRPHQRAEHPFFGSISERQLGNLVDTFYAQLPRRGMRIFSVVIDKRKLAPYFDQVKLQRKAYELLLERIQNFLAEYHPKHLGVIVADDTSKQMNQSLAMKHNYFLGNGTSSGLRLKNIVEMPFFVRSELSNGIQLADLCAYNIYRAFKAGDPKYKYFEKILPHFYWSKRTRGERLDGLKIFPEDSELVGLGNSIANSYNKRQQEEGGK